MHLVATSLNSPDTTKYIVVVGASVLTVFFVLHFWLAWRRNTRVAESMGGFTPSEASLARVHAVLIFVTVFASMGLAIGAVLVPAVRDFLAAVGEHAGRIRFAAIPVVSLYLLWLRVRIRRSTRERAARAA